MNTPASFPTDNLRLQKLMLTAPAAAAAFAATPEAQAQLVVYDIVDRTVGVGQSFTIGGLGPGWSSTLPNAYDVAEGAASIAFGNPAAKGNADEPSVYAWDKSEPGYASFAWNAPNEPSTLLRLSAGMTIDQDLDWKRGSVYLEYNGVGPWHGASTEKAYMGIRVTNDKGGNFHYGWVSLSYDDVGNSYTVYEFALNSTPNQGVLAGVAGPTAVPEPAASALLVAAGAAGVAMYRRRRAKAESISQA